MRSDFFKNGIVILDGAMGTVLQQKGLPPGGQPELLNLTDPALLREETLLRVEAQLQGAVDAARLGGIGYDEVCETLRLLWEEQV